jgi:hypothetical protein
MTETPDVPTQSEAQAPTGEPTEEQLRSDEARRYRQRLRETEDANAELVKRMAEVNTRAEAAERQAVDAQLRGRFADTADFWSQTELAQLRGEDGNVSMDAVTAHADELLIGHPHWRAIPQHGAANADNVTGSGLIGHGPRNMLDVDTVQTEGGPRDWAGFLQAAARGEPPQ